MASEIRECQDCKYYDCALDEIDNPFSGRLYDKLVEWCTYGGQRETLWWDCANYKAKEGDK
ncbi:MAG: hypothetical protein GY832_22110 [Chloroflexi bacterium]|nr:hypothetical protein [Chloroflexota bacterium]